MPEEVLNDGTDDKHDVVYLEKHVVRVVEPKARCEALRNPEAVGLRDRPDSGVLLPDGDRGSNAPRDAFMEAFHQQISVNF